YNKPALSNYYCSHECPIGRKYVPEVEIKDLSQITLEALSTLNALEKEKTRFIDIAADNKISDAEKQDFATIQEKLEKISMIADSLRLWMEQQSQT
ncbi:MAG: XRE family transcriptional regulator, partial [Lachnospiraceae bacterium]|nr:XRE family transcriptional regulator [Lachnospiraceae bacterium]